MRKYIPILRKSKIFAGLSEEETGAMLSCLGAKLRRYKKGEYILRCGDSLGNILVLTEGRAHILRDDYWGKRSILGQVEPGDMFGEAYAGMESGPIMNDVLALEDSAVMFFDLNRVIISCSNSCSFHTRVVQNMFFAISEKNRRLVQKMHHITRRSTREKLMSYLSEEASRHNSASFDIPFNRQQLADFLSVERSAMSAELCRMRDEGLIKFRKNSFELLASGEKL